MLILLDQNVPRAVAAWFRIRRPSWRVVHTSELGLSRMSDEVIADWALSNEAVVITFDEDFADRRRFPPGARPATVRLRVWPTTQDVIEEALGRLLAQVSESSLVGSSIVVDRSRIRLQPR